MVESHANAIGGILLKSMVIGFLMGFLAMGTALVAEPTLPNAMVALN